ncbi:MAG: hypothetical protein P4M14_12760 [Gammaproteobacteria bacterium]|nr:hypothetical protein [Gammaproteobacteria bacterium]
MSQVHNNPILTMSALEKLASLSQPNTLFSGESYQPVHALHLEGLTEKLKQTAEEDRAADLIVTILKNNPDMKEIYLANNTFTENNTRKIMRAIEDHPSMERINLNNFNFGTLANAIPFLESMATDATVKELSIENILPTAELASVAKLTDNSLPEVAKQFLAVYYLYDEIHDQPLQVNEETLEYIGILDSLEKKSIEQSLTSNSNSFDIEYTDADPLKVDAALSSHETEELENTREFTVHYASDENDNTSATDSLQETAEFIVHHASDEIDDTSASLSPVSTDETKAQKVFNYRYEPDDSNTFSTNQPNEQIAEPNLHDTAEFVVEYASDDSDEIVESKTKDQTIKEKPLFEQTEIRIKSIKQLEKLCSMMELQQADSLNEVDTQRLLKIKKIDIDGLYQKLSEDEKEEMIHLIVTIAENAPYLEKVYLAYNDFSAADLKTILTAFSEAKEKPGNQLRKMDLAHSIAPDDLETAASDLGRLQDHLGKDLYLDRNTRKELRGLERVLQKETVQQMSSYKDACADYREYLERKIILPAFRGNKLLRESYSAKDDETLVKKIMHDLMQKSSHPIKALKNDTQVKMAIEKYQIIKALEDITDDKRLSPNKMKAKFDALYYQEKKELPQLLLKNDKPQYIAFLTTIGDTKALNNIKAIGYVAKSRKPKKYFFEETIAPPQKTPTERPTTAKTKSPSSLFFKAKEKNPAEKVERPKTARPGTVQSKNRR